MSSLWLSGFVLLTGCATPEVQSQRLKDGSWSFVCQLPMDECVRRVQDNCHLKRYRVIEGASDTRLRDAPPFEREYHTSRLHLVCSDEADAPLASVAGDKNSAAKPTPTSSKVCTTGETRACIGPGACKGGQACSPDGEGFGTCDCGPVAPAAPAPEPAPSTPPIETNAPTTAP